MVQRPGGLVSWRWWEQEGIDLAGVRERAAAAADREEYRGVVEVAREESKVST